MKRRLRKFADYFSAACFILIVAVIAAWLGRLGEMEYAGSFRVMDGDSLQLGETRFRLEGIDAPEYRQTCTKSGTKWPCGKEAARFLREQMSGGGAVCTGLGEDRFGRVLARCRLDGRDVNREMVANGWAVSFGDYLGAEQTAREAGRGIWQGDFIRPRQWRDLHAEASVEGGKHTLWNRMLSWLRGWF